MELSQLEVFAAVAREKRFSRAARGKRSSDHFSQWRAVVVVGAVGVEVAQPIGASSNRPKSRNEGECMVKPCVCAA